MSAASASHVARAAAWHEARALAWQHRRLLGGALLLVTVNRAAVLAIPFASRELVDDVLVAGRGEHLLPIAAAAAAGVAAQCATAWGVSQLTGIGALRAITGVRTALYTHLLYLPVEFFDRTRTGALIARVMTDTEQLRALVGAGAAQLASGILGSALAFGALLALDARLTIAIALVFAVLAAAAVHGFAGLQHHFQAVSAGVAELSARLADSLGGIRLVKACAAERREGAAFAQRADVLLRAGIRTVDGASLLGAAATLANGVAMLIVLLLGGSAVAGGRMTLGELTTFAFLTGLLGAPVMQMAAMVGDAGRAIAALERIGELRAVGTEEAPDPAHGTRRLRRLRGELEFDDVWYAYVPDGVPALASVSFATRPGSTTAIVGPSGSGKSTVCRLLLAFDNPTRGRVLVDGQDLATLDRAAYRLQLAVVPQDSFLFDATVAENIRYARPEASEAEVRAAARAARCAGFVEALPRGYDSMVGERGVALSGGERQRIAIARALLADPRILILDEPTAHLDPDNEALVQVALRALRQGRTTIVIAHHASAVTDADQVVLLEAGQVRARGNPIDLTRRHGATIGVEQTSRERIS